MGEVRGEPKRREDQRVAKEKKAAHQGVIVEAHGIINEMQDEKEYPEVMMRVRFAADTIPGVERATEYKHFHLSCEHGSEAASGNPPIAQERNPIRYEYINNYK